MIRKNKSVVSKIYLPKYLLILTHMMVLAFKMAVSFALIFVLMAILRVPLTLHVLHAVPILLVLVTVTFGISTIFMHFGVFVRDLSNVTAVLLRLLGVDAEVALNNKLNEFIKRFKQAEEKTGGDLSLLSKSEKREILKGGE